MKRTMRILGAVPLTLLLLGIMTAPATAQTTVQVTFVWTAPTEGTPVDHYVVEHSVNGGPYDQVGTVTGLNYTLVATVGDSHVIRVAGVDDQARQGPYSLSSEPYTPDLGPPGQPGQPVLF